MHRGPSSRRVQSVLPENGPAGGEPSRTTRKARGSNVLESAAAEVADAARESLRRALARAIARVDKRLRAVQSDLSRIAEADAMARRAELFVAQAARAPRGVTRLVAIDWSTGEARNVEMDIDPSSSAQSQVDRLFKRARRLKGGAPIARARLAEAEQIRNELAGLASALEAQPSADVESLSEKARRAAPRDFALSPSSAEGPRRRRAEGARPPYRAFLGSSGSRILVGRKAADNDLLTLRVARPQDLWLHAKGRSGAHVVVPLEKGRSCPPAVLVEAAHLAAHFSDARAERVVEISYTPRRYVRKPRGSAPGLVVVDREKVLALRQVGETLRKLLEREIAT
jgi:predicted ribosome quality control (RQC) complex YloA/Tae2 family protein